MHTRSTTLTAGVSDCDVLPFSDEVCQLLGGNLAMLHVMVEHIKAIIFFTLQRQIDQSLGTSLNNNNNTIIDRTLPWRLSLQAAFSLSAYVPGACAAASGQSYSSLPCLKVMEVKNV